jgi:hypothetical protein
MRGTHKLRSTTNYTNMQHINMRRNHRHNISNARNPTTPKSAPSARPHPNTPYQVLHHTNKRHCHHARDPSASFNHELHPETTYKHVPQPQTQYQQCTEPNNTIIGSIGTATPNHTISSNTPHQQTPLSPCAEPISFVRPLTTPRNNI